MGMFGQHDHEGDGLSPAAWTAIGGVIVVVIGAVVRGAQMLWQQGLLSGTAKQRRNAIDMKNAIDYWRQAVDDERTKTERTAAALDQSTNALRVLQQELTTCQVSHAETVVCLRFIYDHLGKAFSALKDLGHDQGKLPELPELSQHRNVSAEFITRNAIQSAEMVQEANKAPPKVRQTPPPTTDDEGN